MIRLPRQIAGIIAGLWGVLVGYTTQLTLPAWAHLLIVAVGVVLAGLGIIPSTGEAPPATTTGGPWA